MPGLGKLLPSALEVPPWPPTPGMCCWSTADAASLSASPLGSSWCIPTFPAPLSGSRQGCSGLGSGRTWPSLQGTPSGLGRRCVTVHKITRGSQGFPAPQLGQRAPDPGRQLVSAAAGWALGGVRLVAGEE